MLLAPITILLTPTPAFAATCESGFRQHPSEGSPLTLTGTGTARYLFFTLYDAALYAPGNAGNIAASDNLCLEICYRRELEAAVLADAANSILERQNSPDRLTRLAPHVRTLHDAYRPVNRGDRYRLCRDNGRLSLTLNGEPQVSIDNAELARAYLDIWLGEQPLSDELRDALIGTRRPTVSETMGGDPSQPAQKRTPETQNPG